MERKAAILLGILSAAWLSSPSHAAATFVWTCDIEGAPARLTAQVEAISPAGVYMDPQGFFRGSVATGEVNFLYGGSLVSASARYSFTGQNQYADFVDLQTNARFRVQMIVQGRSLTMVVNPFGPGPVRYGCQLAS
jgi:hypothetical protein